MIRERVRRIRRALARALTIEYAIVMMTIVAAFAGLILTTATVTSDNVSGYRDYVERKAFLDDVADAYIRSYCGGDGQIDLEALYGDNGYNFHFTYSADALYVRQGTEHGTVELSVRLADADGDGVREPVAYVYGVA